MLILKHGLNFCEEKKVKSNFLGYVVTFWNNEMQESKCLMLDSPCISFKRGPRGISKKRSITTSPRSGSLSL